MRVKQWIIGLEVMVDPTRLLSAPEETVVAAGDLAADILQGTAERVIDGDGWVGEFGAPPSNDGGLTNEEGTVAVSGPVVQPTAAPTESRQPAERPPQPPKEPSAPPAQRAQAPAPNPSASAVAGSPPEDIALADIDALAIAIGIDPAAFRQYADKRWGQGWSKNPNGRRKAIDELESCRADPDALRQRMNAETQVFA